MSDTGADLREAFAGESQAFQKYMAFADKAQKEGLTNIARLFRTTAAAERIHAEGHLQAMGGVGTTAQNLQAAIGGETHEYSEMYPPMLSRAEAAGHKARRMFGYAVQAEEVHARLYQRALEAVQQGRDLDAPHIYLCPVCGHIELSRPSAACPICGVAAAKYVEV